MASKNMNTVDAFSDDSGTGVYNTDMGFVQLNATQLAVYSKEIEYAAQPLLKFKSFATMRTELNKEPGEQINITKYADLGPGGTLTENIPMSPKAMVNSQISIAVLEKGNAVAVSEKKLRTSFNDEMNTAAKLLGMDQAKVLDGDLYSTLIDGGPSEGAPTNYVYGGNATTEATIDSTDTLSTTEIKDATQVLEENNAPKYPVAGGIYVSFISPKQARNLKDDTGWINANNYANTRALFNGELGMWDDTVFIRTTQIAAASSVASPAVSIYKSPMFGWNSYGLAISLEAELRDNGVQDFGRKHELGWYGLWGSEIVNKDNLVILESA